ncbi:hypothetical protein ACFQY7_05970 [Actinomadura luteofluorescens]|uniref:hypothetical protein n=1 Tax=Actinomadura luteofluorescens TaxID=46163 RepID=UPI00364354FE
MFTRQSRSAAAVCCVFALALTACEGAGTTGADERPPVKGGTLNLLGAGDVDYMDPNISYYTNAEMNLRLWSRRLFGYPARKDQATTPVPDLATEVPTAATGVSARTAAPTRSPCGTADGGTPARRGRSRRRTSCAE